MKKFFQLASSVKLKFISISMILLIIPMVTIGILSYTKSKESLDHLGEINLQNGVEFTLAIIAAYNEEVERGNISLQDAQDKVKNIMLGEMNEEGVRPTNKNVNLGENGYVFAFSQEGMRLAHPSKEGVNAWDEEGENGMKFVQEMITAANNGGGFTYYNTPLVSGDRKKVSFAKTDPAWGWVIVASTFLDDFNSPSTGILTSLIFVCVLSMIIGASIIWIFAIRLTKPISQVTEHMNTLATGDLTKEPIVVTSADEIGHLAEALNTLQQNLQQTMGQVSGTSDVLTAKSETLAHSANNIKHESMNIASTIDQLATGADIQARQGSNLAIGMSTFSDSVEETNQIGIQIESNSKAVLTMANEGTSLMKKSIEQMEKIHIIVNESVQKVSDLDKQSQEISNLVTVIKSVAEQTNLLALNAAIEAARAGEFGTGFAVVADEVRHLSEQVANSVMDITEIVNSIQKETTFVSQSLKVGYEEVNEGKLQIEATGETFESIYASVTEMVERITIMAGNLSEISVSSKLMNGSVEEIAAISQQSATGVEQIGLSVQQTNGTIDEVANHAGQLATLAEQLNKLVSQFRLV